MYNRTLRREHSVIRGTKNLRNRLSYFLLLISIHFTSYTTFRICQALFSNSITLVIDLDRFYEIHYLPRRWIRIDTPT
jgi:hypothetical protein